MSMPFLKAMLTLPMKIPTAMFILSQPMAPSIQPCQTQHCQDHQDHQYSFPSRMENLLVAMLTLCGSHRDILNMTFSIWLIFLQAMCQLWMFLDPRTSIVSHFFSVPGSSEGGQCCAWWWPPGTPRGWWTGNQSSCLNTGGTLCQHQWVYPGGVVCLECGHLSHCMVRHPPGWYWEGQL